MRVGLAIVAVCLALVVGCGQARNKTAGGGPDPHNPGLIVLDGALETDATPPPRGCCSLGAYYALRPDGTGVRKLAFPHGDSELSFSADGRFAAMSSQTATVGHMVVVSRADGSERRVVPLSPQDLAGSPSLSPDGNRLALAYTQDAGKPGPSNLWTVSVDGGGLKRLSSTGDVFSVAWSPDGEHIAFVDGDQGDIYVIGADGSDLHRVGRAFTVFDVELSWSPDSNRIAFVDEDERVSSVDANGGKVEVVSPNGQAPAWSPDGKRIAFLRDVPGHAGLDRGIFIVDVKEGVARRVGPAFGDYPDRLSWTTASLLPAEGSKRALNPRDLTKSGNLHKVDWGNVTLPGAVCGAEHPIRLRNHRAVVVSTRWPDVPRVTVASGWNPVVYGDVDGDGADEAALVVDCNIGGGTASGVLAYAQVIFTAAEHAPRALGVLTPQSPRTYGAPLLEVKIHRGEIVAQEFWYGPNDGTCCPSGRAVTTWTYASGALRLSKTVVERKPRA